MSCVQLQSNVAEKSRRKRCAFGIPHKSVPMKLLHSALAQRGSRPHSKWSEYNTWTCLPSAIIAALNELANAPSSPFSPPKRFAKTKKRIQCIYRMSRDKQALKSSKLTAYLPKGGWNTRGDLLAHRLPAQRHLGKSARNKCHQQIEQLCYR
jgi:hypothetical protein